MNLFALSRVFRLLSSGFFLLLLLSYTVSSCGRVYVDVVGVDDSAAPFLFFVPSPERRSRPPSSPQLPRLFPVCRFLSTLAVQCHPITLPMFLMRCRSPLQLLEGLESVLETVRPPSLTQSFSINSYVPRLPKAGETLHGRRFTVMTSHE